MALFGTMATTASAAVGDPFFNSCLNAGTAWGSCTSLNELVRGRPEALSPDGKQLYVATGGGTPYSGGSGQAASVLVFNRAAQSGALTYGSSVTTAAISDPQDVVVSPDGANVYVSNAGSSTISEFIRNSDGSLASLPQSVSSGAGWGQPHGMAISPGGETMYVSTSSGTALVFDRSAGGALTQKAAPDGCFSETAQPDCQVGRGIGNRSWQIAVSPAGSEVYATGYQAAYDYYTNLHECIYGPHICADRHIQPASGSVATFVRHADGTLSQAATSAGCLSSDGTDGGTPSRGFSSDPQVTNLYEPGAGGYADEYPPGAYDPGAPAPADRCTNAAQPALALARSLTLAPDGSSLYVGTDAALVSYRRGTGGSLTQIGCLQKPGAGMAGCTDAPAIGDTHRLSVTPDGSAVISAFDNDAGGFAFLKRDTGTGALSQHIGDARCVTQDGTGGACATNPALGGYGSAVASPDSKFFYLTAQRFGTVAVYYPDAAPDCQDVSANVVENEAHGIALSCSDPNGDPVTLQVGGAPSAGTLGAFDSAGQGVPYDPFGDFSGNDSFTYTAMGRGVLSAPAKATITVRAPLADVGASGSFVPSSVPKDSYVVLSRTLSNPGVNPAYRVTLEEALPPGLALVAATGPAGACSAGPTVTCRVGTLPAGQSRQVDMVVRADAVGTQTSTGRVSSENDPAPGNDEAAASLTVTAAPAAATPADSVQLCKVPRVVGLRIAAARSKLARAGCRLGRVAHQGTRRGRGEYRIKSQLVPAGIEVRAATRIDAIGRWVRTRRPR